jgi:hypothetical protein
VNLRQAIRTRRLRGQLLQAVDEAYLMATQLKGQIDAAEPSTIHRLRIAFKKFRYMVEIVRPILPAHPEEYLKQMREYQGHMGGIQDMAVFFSALEEFGTAKGSAFDLTELRANLEARRAMLVKTFLNHRDDLQQFWRTQPDQSFPWEKSNESTHRSSRNRRPRGDKRNGGGQPEAADRKGTKKDAQDRAGLEGAGGAGGLDPDQPLPAGNPNGENPEEGV